MSIPKVSFTTFADFAAASGTSRLTKLRNAKRFYEQDYAPARDFYRPLRECIEETFEQGWSSAGFKKALKEVTSAKRVEHYEECREGLSKWVGKKKIEMLPRFRATWKSGPLSVTVNPELHVKINGVPHLLKLYFKSEPLSKQNINIALHLLQKKAPKGTTAGILDVRRSKLFTPTVTIPGMDAFLKAEATAFSSLWASI